MLVIAIISFIITVFIGRVGAGFAGISQVDGGFVVLSAANLAGVAIDLRGLPRSLPGPLRMPYRRPNDPGRMRRRYRL